MERGKGDVKTRRQDGGKIITHPNLSHSPRERLYIGCTRSIQNTRVYRYRLRHGVLLLDGPRDAPSPIRGPTYHSMKGSNTEQYGPYICHFVYELKRPTNKIMEFLL